MTKNFFGGATINSGPVLPAASDTPDGSLFYKTSAPQGLYFFGFNPDANSGTLGDQTTQSWSLLIDASGSNPYVLRAGDTMSGNLVGTAFRATQGLPSGDASVVGFAFGADGDTGLFSTGSSGSGSTVSLCLNGVERLQVTAGNVTIAGSTVWHAGNLTNLSQLSNGPGYITSSYFGGGLPVAQGGTGQTAGLTQGGVVYGSTPAAMAVTAVGTSGQLLRSNASSAPSWIDASTLSVGSAVTANFATSAGSAGTANTLTTPRTITLSGGATSSPTSFDGSGNIVIPVTTLNAGSLSGTVAVGALSGTYNINISGSAALNVLKAGDTMTGGLFVPSIAVGAVSMPSTGAISTSGSIVSSGGNILTSTGFVSAGDNTSSAGYIRMQSSGSGSSGYLEFWPGNNIRSGYIGNTSAAGSTDTGTVNYVTGTHAFSGNMTVSGSIVAQGNITAFSDRRLKSNITTITDPIYKVSQLEGVNFNREGFEERFTGLIAQDVLAVMPEAVIADADGTLSVAYGNLVGLLVEAVKAQQSQIDELKSMVSALLRSY